MSERLLVTGGTGLIGRHLLPVLARDYEVWAVVRTEPERLPGGVRAVVHDLATPRLPAELPRAAHGVVHLAQSERFRDFPQEARDIFEVNVGSTARLLDWTRAVGAKRFVYASSGGIYGHGETGFREDEVRPSRPLGFYLASKQCAELLVESYTPHLQVAILRPFFAYGPGQRATMLIPRLVRAIAGGRPVTLQGEHGLRLNPVHVDDAVRAMERALHLPESHKINVAGPETLTLREIAEAIGQELGRTPVFERRPGAPAHLVGDIERMTALLGAPRIRFRDAIGTLCREVVAA